MSRYGNILEVYCVPVRPSYIYFSTHIPTSTSLEVCVNVMHKGFDSIKAKTFYTVKVYMFWLLSFVWFQEKGMVVKSSSTKAIIVCHIHDLTTSSTSNQSLMLASQTNGIKLLQSIQLRFVANQPLKHCFRWTSLLLHVIFCESSISNWI